MSKKLFIGYFVVLAVFLCCIFGVTVNYISAYADVVEDPAEYTMTQVVNGQYITMEDTVTINSAEELRAFANYVNDANNVSNINFKLTTNIELNENTDNYYNWEYSPPTNVWTPIGTVSSPFNGYFYGQGFTINGVYINSTENYQGLFGYNSGYIFDIGVINFFIKGGSMVGGAGWLQR